ncbi:MAG: aminopeptidase P family protein [Bacteroidales bacterium]|nr:aminopeptidase P family protein [Bacteroidales bacterium]
MTEMLENLRVEMQKRHICAYLIFNTDDHNSEYIPQDFMFVKALTGFTGDNAVVIVTENFAGLWTDSRFFLSGAQELENSGFTLKKDSSYTAFLKENIKPGSTVGFSGGLITAYKFLELKRKFSGINFLDVDLIGKVWKDRPEKKLSEIFFLEEKFSGESSMSKLSRLREKISENGASYFLTSGLDDIAWCLNLRASDIDFCPVFRSFLAVEKDKDAYLFIHENRLSNSQKEYLSSLGVKICGYDSVYEFHKNIPENAALLLDTKTVNSRLYLSFTQKIIDKPSPVQLMKAVKNSTELKNMRLSMIDDGLALERFFFKFEKNLEEGVKMTELSAAKMLLEERQKSENFLFESFECISAFNPHAAMPHFAPSEKDNLEIKKDGVYLVDSGGQYFLGTTDVTRTIPTGKITEDFARDYTLVLIGNINIAMQKFPEGTPGSHLDVLARQALWQYGLDFGHGTGHGVGYCLNCHEGPQAFSTSAARNNAVAFLPGMIITDEPGFYKENCYGIRHEHILEVVESKTKGFLEFSVMTLCHIDTRPVKKELMTEAQINFLNDYNKKVYETLSPYLNESEKEYLKKRTAPV